MDEVEHISEENSEVGLEKLEKMVNDLKSLVMESTRMISCLEQKAIECEARLKIYDLCSMFNYYRTQHIVYLVGCATFQEFASVFADNNAMVKDGEMTRVDFNAWVQPIRDQLGDIDIEEVVRVSLACHGPNYDLLAKRDQEEFLLSCKSFDFGVYGDLALKIIVQLETVELQRTNGFCHCGSSIWQF